MSYLFLSFKDGKSLIYSCINAHKVAVTQTLSLLDPNWNERLVLFKTKRAKI